ncbi:hypothetical protein [Mycoplasma procyoni]|uniref:hypothetical protein n=1 Tax=Mycoplasma procyoni TaxID=568784 RepID=UPI00197C5F41|nr:hypothetical protein [Mycoplasma procyoni]MBN3534638.1 hypothetical protein [Mycoplasma procyoni]
MKISKLLSHILFISSATISSISLFSCSNLSKDVDKHSSKEDDGNNQAKINFKEIKKFSTLDFSEEISFESVDFPVDKEIEKPNFIINTIADSNEDSANIIKNQTELNDYIEQYKKRFLSENEANNQKLEEKFTEFKNSISKTFDSSFFTSNFVVSLNVVKQNKASIEKIVKINKSKDDIKFDLASQYLIQTNWNWQEKRYNEAFAISYGNNLDIENDEGATLFFAFKKEDFDLEKLKVSKNSFYYDVSKDKKTFYIHKF